MIKALFLAANPGGTPKLRLDEEVREISKRLRPTKQCHDIQLEAMWAARLDDVRQALLETQPHALHFCGDGSYDDQITLQDDEDRPEKVSTEALSRLLSILRDNLRIVICNSCYMASQTATITEFVDCAIGMKKSFGNEAEILFSGAFYQALGFGWSVLEAFELGCNALQLKGIAEENVPGLFCKEGIDPAEVVFFHDRQVIVAVELTLDCHHQDFGEAEFRRSLATVIGGDASKVRIVSTRAGSTIVTLDGAPDALARLFFMLLSSDGQWRDIPGEALLQGVTAKLWDGAEVRLDLTGDGASQDENSDKIDEKDEHQSIVEEHSAPVAEPSKTSSFGLATTPHVRPSDESSETSLTLLARIRADDQEAWERLVTLYSPLVFRRCVRKGLNEEDAADVSQQVFSAVHQNINSFRRDRAGDSFRAWLSVITLRKIQDFFRRSQRNQAAIGGSAGQDRLDRTPAPEDPSSELEVSEEKTLLAHRMLELVRSEFRDVHFQAFLRRIDGQPAAEVAEDLGIKRQAVHNAFARIKRRLRTEFRELVDDDLFE